MRMKRTTAFGFLTPSRPITRCARRVDTGRPVLQSGVWVRKIRRFGQYWAIRRPRRQMSLKRIVYGYQVDFEGSGEILKVVSRPQDGWRNLDIDVTDGYIKNEDFVAIPSSYVIQREGDHPGLIALTFDDGPDPQLDAGNSRHSQTSKMFRPHSLLSGRTDRLIRT